jgi:hypothetical protein
MNKISLLIILLTLISCHKKETLLQKENAIEFPVIDSKFPLYISKIDFESKYNLVQLNDEINSKILKTVINYYNTESGVDETYKKEFSLKDCYFKTIRLQDKSQTIFVIILKSFPTKELSSKVLFYDNISKQFIGNPIDFKIYALYDFVNGKIKPTNLKKLFKIEIPEINITDKDNDGKNEFEFTRLYHNGTYNAIELSLLKVTKNKIDTIQNTKKML